MKSIIQSAFIATILSGCSILEPTPFDTEIPNVSSTETIQENIPQGIDQRAKSLAFQSSYRKQLLGIDSNPQTQVHEGNRNINFYVRGMMQDLVGNLRFVNAQTPVAVTNFVFLDSDFEQADLIGMQLSESFMHEVHKFGIPVIDFKTTDYVRVSRSGDFVLSKDYLELNGELPIKYVLAGTLVKNVSGYNVNARIVGINSKAIVASAQGFIPESVISRVMSSNMNDGIPIISNGASY